MRAALAAAFVFAVVGAATATVHAGRPANAYTLHRLVADRAGHAPHADAAMVNAWGLAASPTGPWWTSNEARGRSTLYAADGKKQSLTVVVDGGPTGIAYNGGRGFVVRGGGVSAPARFVYACEDGMLRGWAPSVPHG